MQDGLYPSGVIRPSPDFAIASKVTGSLGSTVYQATLESDCFYHQLISTPLDECWHKDKNSS